MRNNKINTDALSSLSLIRYFPLAICLLLAAFLTGCATIPAHKAAGFPVENFYINNITYYPLSSVCRYLHIDWDYDPLGRQVSLKKADTEVKLLIDSQMVLVNGSPLDIGQPVIIHNGSAVIPLKLKEMVIDKFYCPVLPEKTPAYALAHALRRIVVDAGHGGHDPGAIGRTGLREKDVNLDIARRLSNLLEAKGIEAVMTRSVDKFITLEQRAEIANRARADFFVSLHSNSARSSRLSGFEVYYVTDKLSDTERALRAARSADLNIEPSSFYKDSLDLKATLWDMLYTRYRGDSIILAQSICESAGRGMGVKILGVKSAPFYVLKGARIPAVLVEVGFVSNPSEERYLRNSFYRQQIAEAICDGILRYGRQYELAQGE